MLVLTRRLGEEIVFGAETVVVRVVGIGPDRVRLGVDAPREMTVHRREVFEAIRVKEEKRG